MNDLPGARRYSDREVSVILRRATELQKAAPRSPDPNGLTLSELEEIAQEAGIATELLRQAAGELERHGPAPIWDALLGGPTQIRLERSVAGELDEASLAELVPVIQRAADAPGQASTVGRTLTWSSVVPGNTRSLQVLVASRKGETLIRIEERLGSLAGALHGGITGGGGGAAAGLAGPLVAAATGSAFLTGGAVLATLGIGYALARGLFRKQTRRRRRILDQLMFEVIHRVQERVAAAPFGEGESGSAGS